MHKYDLIKQIGDGTFGSVCKAKHKESGQFVAVKRMKQKYYSWQECIALPEVNVLRKLRQHPNIIKLMEVVRENNELFFVFEFMDGDLLGEIKKAKTLNLQNGMRGGLPGCAHTKCKSYMHQLLQSLAHLHKSGYFHRDLKPENMLIRRDNVTGHETIKLADFGLVKEVRARPPFTDYVSTRWYRAPEILLQDKHYNSPVDIWAAGCIMAELYTSRPLFPGSNEVDQIFKICSVFGSPDERTWPAGMQLARKIRYSFPMVVPTPLQSILGALPPQALDLITQMLAMDPTKRITAAQALQHPYFQVGLDEEPLVPIAAAQKIPRGSGTTSAPPGNVMVPQPVADPLQKQANMGGASEKPGSEGRPRYPPVQITKPNSVLDGAPGTATDTLPSAYSTGAFSKYYIKPAQPQPAPVSSTTVASGNSPPQHRGSLPPSGRSPPSNVTAPSPQLTKTPSIHNQPSPGPLKPLTRFSPTAMIPTGKQGITPKRSVQPLIPVSGGSATRNSPSPTGGVDLDALMNDFATELGQLSASKRNTAVKPLDSSTKRSPQQQAGFNASTGLSSIPSLASPLAASGSASFKAHGESSLQDLLSSSRYKVSPMKTSTGGVGTTTPLSTSKRSVKALSPAVKVVLNNQRSGAAAASGSPSGLPFVNRSPVMGGVQHGRRAAGGEATRLRPMIPDQK